MTEIITPRLIIRGFMKKDAEALGDAANLLI